MSKTAAYGHLPAQETGPGGPRARAPPYCRAGRGWGAASEAAGPAGVVGGRVVLRDEGERCPRGQSPNRLNSPACLPFTELTGMREVLFSLLRMCHLSAPICTSVMADNSVKSENAVAPRLLMEKSAGVVWSPKRKQDGLEPSPHLLEASPVRNGDSSVSTSTLGSELVPAGRI